MKILIQHRVHKEHRVAQRKKNSVTLRVLCVSVLKKSLFLLCLSCTLPCHAQNFSSQCENTQRIMFYNVENLYDTQHDLGKNDYEFLPDGVRYWTNSRFYSKLKNLYKVFSANGTPAPPTIIALCEVENDFVLRKLIETTPLKNFGYDFVHHESPDIRGVDCALLYRKQNFELFDSHPFQITFPFDTASKTRDILYVKGLLFEEHLIHIFVNHWPSRYGGQAPTMPKRNYVAQQLRKICDSILNDNPNANILILGDLNDDPTDESVAQFLCGQRSPSDTLLLTNLSLPLFQKGQGTIKHGTQWCLFDQTIVSPALTDGRNGLQICNDAIIFNHDFLFVDDETNMGKKLFRTYNGMTYAGGYADHLPVGVDVKKVKQE
ncbi:MAG: endonuclease/exonuclease/phosphatase family protein [Bacteroidales bacterium]|nr:endonuclease/exonuclease/phosphatase family protein [Bacteroidales bacterium]